MNKNVKIVLTYLNKYNYIKNYELKSDLPISHQDLRETLNYLVHEDIIERENVTEWENGFKHQNLYFYSTLISRNYYKNRIKDSIIRCLKTLLFHIIFPIAVAYITTIITVHNNECCTNSDSNRTNQTENP